jgi:catechol 2,3-dioxygenase-like lactoylglutathione lyase family enzyme
MPRKPSSAKSLRPALTTIERVIFYVKDTERSARWYQETLGVPIRFKSPGWVELDTRGVTLCLHGGRKSGPAAEQPSVGFRVRSFDAALKSLRLREVPGLSGPFEPVPGVRCASFQDPDGNPLGIEGK